MSDINVRMVASLDEWRRREQLTLVELKALLRASSHSRVAAWCKGMSMPRDPRMLSRIAQVTGGEVTVDVLYAHYARQKGAAAERLLHGTAAE